MTQNQNLEPDEAAGDGLDAEAAQRLSRALRAALGSAPEVSPDRDARILQAASGRLGELRRRAEVRRVPSRSPRWRWAPALATAAAVLLLVWVQLDGTGRGRRRPVGGTASDHPLRMGDAALDLDGTGRVDVLDAFFLARQIEQGAPLERQWDVDGDGQVARGDVDRIARAAVRLP